MEREAAWQLVCEFVEDEGLKRHMLSVEAAMRWYAQSLGEDVEEWGAIGLIHDFDWEIHPTLPDHPLKGAEILRQRGVEEEIVRSVLSHYTVGTGVERERSVDFGLLACDEVTGLLVATALVRPSKNIREVAVKSVRKKWKDRSFAAGVNREEVEGATADFSRACFDGQLELWEHVSNVLTAMQSMATELGLAGRIGQETDSE